MSALTAHLTEPRRRWVYGVAMAAAPLLVAANVVTPDDAALWLNLVASILLLGSSGLAAANVGAAPEYQGRHRLEE